jgi:hypothetical protein
MKRKHPDLFYNRGTIYEYLESYQLAVKDFETANSIDPSLNADEKIKRLAKHFRHCVYLIDNKVLISPLFTPRAA